MNTEILLSQIVSALLAYLLGSVPFGFLLTKMAGLGDIRKIGSGNIGATNVLRTGHKKLAFLTLLLDGGKGSVAVLLAAHFIPNTELTAAVFVLIGHLYPVWLRFKGGKGVATYVGVLTALTWPIGLTIMILWTSIAKLSRYSSVASVIAISLSPILDVVMGPGKAWPELTFMAFLVLLKHRANITRLVQGEEPKIGQDKNTSPPKMP